MRIISLNTWGGRAGKERLLAFLERESLTTDVFTLQEIWSAPYEHLEGQDAGGLEIDHKKIMVYGLQDISAALPNHVPYFRPHHLENYGLLTLVSKSLTVLDEGELFVHKYKGFIPAGDVGLHARNIQHVTIQTDQHPTTIINFHGLWNGKGKGDSPDRLEQSDKILRFIKNLQNPFVMSGDFNLLPDTESIRKFENAGLRNLIKEFGVTSTRTDLYAKSEKFADYVFISATILLKDFRVLSDEVSDHTPLAIEIE